MNAGNYIELAGIVLTFLGGGSVGVAKLTRIAVAAENLAEQIKAITEQQKDTQTQVTDHENRLNRGGL